MKGTFYHVNKTNNAILNPEERLNAEKGALDYQVEGKWFGAAELKGGRGFQEDRMIAIAFSEDEKKTYDKLSQSQKITLLKETYAELNKNIVRNDVIKNEGSTGLVAITEPEQNRVLFANLGDSQLIGIHLKKNGKCFVQRLNSLHNPTEASETERIKKAGGIIFRGALGGGLGVSRAFGDAIYLEYGLSCQPDVKFQTFNAEEGDEIFLVAACDGLTEKDCLTLNDIATYIATNRQKPLSTLALGLANLAYEAGSGDNLSVQVCKLLPATKERGILGIFDGHGNKGAGHVVAEYLKDTFFPIFKKKLALLAEAVEEKLPATLPKRPATTIKKSSPIQPTLKTSPTKQSVPQISPPKQPVSSPVKKPKQGKSTKPSEIRSQPITQNTPAPNKKEATKNTYASFLPIGMLGTGLATGLFAVMSPFILLTMSIIILGSVALWKEYQAFKGYKVQNLAEFKLKHRANKNSANDVNYAFDLGMQSSTDFLTTLKSCVTPMLWLYPEQVNAYYAGQAAQEANDVQLIKHLQRPKNR